MTNTVILFSLAALAVASGLAGMVLPGIPGPPLLFLGLLLAAWAENFEYVGAWTLTLLGILAGLAYAIDFIAGSVGARKFGASKRAMTGAAIGAVIGIFFGLPGLLLGPFLGAVIGEIASRNTVAQAGKAGFGATLGIAVGVAVKVAFAVSMIAIFLLARFLS